jgi:hypothetical protein
MRTGNKALYVVHLVREAKAPSRFFAVLKPPDFGAACLHAIGVSCNFNKLVDS